MSVSGTPGTGPITLGSAILDATDGDYVSCADAYGANAISDFLFVDGHKTSIERDVAYTHSGTTLTRGTVEATWDGSTLSTSPLSLTSAAKVYVIESAERIGRNVITHQAMIPGGRLTLTTGVPVTTSDVTAATTIYYTPYIHNIITLWDGAGWKPIEFSEVSLALGTVTSDKPYDVFGYLSAGALVLEKLVWTNDTTRATNITIQDGRYCKSGDKARLYLGSFYTTSTTTTEHSAAKQYVWNKYNKVENYAYKIMGDSSHSYQSSTARYYNNDSSARIDILTGLQEATIQALSTGVVTQDSGSLAIVGIMDNVTNSIGSGRVDIQSGASYTSTRLQGSRTYLPILGKQFYAIGEATGAASVTFNYGGLHLRVWN